MTISRQPVTRYLQMALPTTKHIQELRIRQTGTLRTDVNSERRMSFEAEHLVLPPATGFVWNARVRSCSDDTRSRPRRAHRGERFRAGQSAVGVHRERGCQYAGDERRFVAPVLGRSGLVSDGIAAKPDTQMDRDRRDQVAGDAENRGVTVALEFRFAETGEVRGIDTPGRWGTFGGSYEHRPWEGHFRNYERRDGFWVPREGDVGWYVEDEWHAVWKGTVLDFEIRQST